MKRIFNAFKYSCHGFVAAFKSEAAFRQNLLIFVIGTVAAIFLPIGPVTKYMLVSALLLILLMELVNTAIETVVDRISADIHPLSKKAKDIGSLLVLISYINALLIWGIVIWQMI